MYVAFTARFNSLLLVPLLFHTLDESVVSETASHGDLEPRGKFASVEEDERYFQAVKLSRINLHLLDRLRVRASHFSSWSLAISKRMGKLLPDAVVLKAFRKMRSQSFSS